MDDLTRNLRDLLLVSYRFPPIGGSGVQRMAKLAKYLPMHGWRGHVICCDHGRAPLMDETLSAEIGMATKLHRTHGWDPDSVAACLERRLGCLGHDRAGQWADRVGWRMGRVVDHLLPRERELLWAPAAIRMARKVVAQHAIEAVITSGPAHAVHLVGRAIRQRAALPWIADLRDPIVDNWSCQYDGTRARGYWRWLEGLVVSQADGIVMTCRGAMESLLARHPLLDTEKVSCLPNGFDPADAPESTSTRKPGHFVIAHVGAFYREQSVGPILEAVRQVRVRNDQATRCMRLRLVGSVSASQQHLFRSDDHAFMSMGGYVSHCDAVGEIRDADLLLLMTPENDGGRTCIPAKTFEYLAFGGRVLAIARRGTHLEEILTQSGGCDVVEPGDIGRLADAIETIFRAWQQGDAPTWRDASLLEKYRRDRQAGQYAAIVERTIQSRRKTQRDIQLHNEARRVPTAGGVS